MLPQLLGSLPIAVIEGESPRGIVIVANKAAKQLGIHAGLSQTAAQGLANDLLLLPRSIKLEQTTLERLAQVALIYTPEVSFMNQTVLLNIEKSLRLFGGLHQLAAKLKTDAEQTQISFTTGLAPTPRAAWLFAKMKLHHPQQRSVQRLTHLQASLEPLPLQLFEWPQDTIKSFVQLGVNTIQQLMRLPRAGVIKRFGALPLMLLDQALGHTPDPQTYYVSPEQFERSIELVKETDDAEHIQHGLDLIFNDLVMFLRARALQTNSIQITLQHSREATSRFIIGTAEYTRDITRWQRLVREQLNRPLGVPDDPNKSKRKKPTYSKHTKREALAEKVFAIHVKALALQQEQQMNQSLLSAHDRDALTAQLDVQQCVERLNARLGSGSAFRIEPAHDHRPDLSWKSTDVALTNARGRTRPTEAPHQVDATDGPAINRPVQLLTTPRKLVVRYEASDEARVHYHGPLRLVSGPERIETGWWDGAPARRDYYIARNALGETVWIFEDLNQGKRKPPDESQWYLHGFFA
jgi:protein ImuB